MSLPPSRGGEPVQSPQGRPAGAQRGSRSKFALASAYLLALVLPIATVAGRVSAAPWLGEHPTLTIYLVPILIVAYVGGLGPGILATALAALATAYFTLPPVNNFGIDRPGDLVAWAAMVLSGVAVSALAEIQYRARDAEHSEAALPVEWKVNTGFSVALVVLCVVGAISYYSIGQMGESLAAARRSEKLIDSMKTLVSNIRDVETSVGRFVITGGERQLEGFDPLVGKVNEQLRVLGERLRDRVEYLERFDGVSRLVARRLEVARAVIVLRRSGAAPAQAAIAGGEGRQILDDLRQLLDDMERAEDEVEHAREVQSTRYGAISRATITVGIALASMFMLASMFVIRRDLAGRRRAESLLREAKGSLETRVAERTAELAHRTESLLEREQQLDGIVDSAMDAIVTTDEEQRIVVFNPAAERMFRLPAGSVVGANLEMLMPLRFRARHTSNVRAFGDTNVTSRAMGGAAEVLGLRADGSEFALEASISQANRTGRKFFTAILRDITQRKHAEDALKASEAQLRSVTDAVPALIAHIGADYRYLYANQAYADWFGRTRAEIVGRSMEDVLGVESFALAAPDVAAALAGATIPFDRSATRHDGEKRDVGGVMIPETGAGGRTVGIFLLANDHTDRRRSEALLQRTESMKALGTLAGGIAHDFNNILPAIRGFAALAVEELPEGHPSREYLERIEKAAERASDLVRRILAFSRPQEAAAQRMDLGAAVDDALKLVDAVVPAMIKLRVALAHGMPEIDADPTEVYQIVLNLLTNAVHAIGSNPGLIEVGLGRIRGGETRSGSALENRDYLCLTVADSGCGMDAATQARVFDPFFTTKAVGQGTGLGLSILHGIMKKAGGEIAVYSDIGRGTQFSLYFPVPPGESRGVLPVVAQVVRGSGQRLMYVDDEAPLVFLATFILKRLGYEVRGFTSPLEALEAFRAHPADFDALVTDLSMPGMSGFDFAKQVLAVRPGIPVVMASGYVRPEDEERARECGVRRVVSKPSTVQEYAAALDGIFVG